MSEKNQSLPTPEINSYRDKENGAVVIHYQEGVLKNTYPIRKDKIEWDGLKHEVAFYEEELNLEIFELVG